MEELVEIITWYETFCDLVLGKLFVSEEEITRSLVLYFMFDLH